MFLMLTASGFAVFNYMQDRILQENLTKTTETVKSMWNMATVVHKETMEAYLRYYILDDEVLEIFELAHVPEKQPEVRAKLFRHLYSKYNELRNRLSVRQLNFILPDNTMFIRFHSPNRYGDDLSSARPSVVYVNKEKKPFFGLEMGKSILGYRYIFPVFNKKGAYLGCIELSRPFEIIRRDLKQIDERGEYILLINKEEIEKKLFEEYKGYYQPFAGLDEWLVESTEGKLVDAPKPMKKECLNVLRSINLEHLLNSPLDSTVYSHYNGRYYKVSVIKFKPPFENTKPLLLLRVSMGEDIEPIIRTVDEFKIIYSLLVAFISIGMTLYLNRNYSIRLKNKELEIIASTMANGLVILDTEGKVKFINQTALDILGFSQQEILGSSFHEAVHQHTGPKEICPVFLAIKNKKEYTVDDTFRTKENKFIDVSLKLRPLIIDNNYAGAIVVFDDITERKQLEKKLFNLATRDSLTGLYNRRYALENLRKLKALSDRYRHPLSIIMLDIDNFKKINDTYGHDIGDEVLKSVAKIIKDSIRSSDIPSRWGGEEFIVILPNTSLDGAINLAERIREGISKIEAGPVKNVTVSIGVAEYMPDESLDRLISRADKGLYAAKRSGKNRVIAVTT